MVFVRDVRARARCCDAVRREDWRCWAVGSRVGIWRCRKEELVVGFRMRERERAVLWIFVLKRAQS